METIPLPDSSSAPAGLPEETLRLIQSAVNAAMTKEQLQHAIYYCASELSRNLPFMLQVHESLRAAKWVTENIPLHKRYSHLELRREAVMSAPENGLFLEFGVWKGHWISEMARMRNVPFFGFDSFEGIPDDWSIYNKAHFNLGGNLPSVPENVSLIKGWFNESLPGFLEEHRGPVSFIHMDCDLYSSTKTVLDLLKPRIQPGTTMVLDDYLIEPGWDQAEFLAFNQFVKYHGMTFEYLGYVTDTPSTAVAVRFLSV